MKERIKTKKCFIKSTIPFILGMVVLGLLSYCTQQSEKDYPIRAIPLSQVQMQDGFWSGRIDTGREATLPYTFRKCEETGRIDNFAIAGGLKTGQQNGVYPFDDTDVYKTIEGASYSLILHPDPQLDQYLDSLIVQIAAAQEEDGYLYTARKNKPEWLVRRSGADRWSNLAWSHELYNAGHHYEAAVAHYHATGKRSLLNIALKNADLIDNVFGPAKIQSPPGHQEIEIGLVKLYRVTGQEKYLRLAKFFLDQRGYSHNGRELWGEYAQDHKPVLEQTEAVGHAVRAPYMYSAMLDVAALTGDTRYAEASIKLWENVVGKKLYITGGLGAVGMSERFAGNYDLPNKSAYQETCASIANVFWNQRLFLYTGEAKYIDVLERTLYNALLSGVALGGDLFFYPNVLASRGYHERFPWFDCACCITNMSRFMPSLPGYIYALENDKIYLNLFAGSEAVIPLGNNNIRIVQETRYPWEGMVKITVDPQQPGDFELRIRIPGWAQNQPVPGDLYRFQNTTGETPAMALNGEPILLSMDKGYAFIRRRWKQGDVVELHLPMPVRRVIANGNVAEDRAKTALQRGPIIYCLEWPDNRNGRVLNLVLPDNAPLRAEYHSDLLNGVEIIRGNAISVAYAKDGTTLLQEAQEFTAIPYYAWAHRGMGEMAVWIARDPSAAQPLDSPPLAAICRASASVGTGLPALNDRQSPRNSGDASQGVFTWSRNDTLYVQYDFPQPEDVSAARIYWFADQKEQCLPPASWRILALCEDGWKAVYTPYKTWGVKENTFNRVIFETVRTGALRLEAYPQPGFTSGILEWEVD